jgi:hypothetical protein
MLPVQVSAGVLLQAVLLLGELKTSHLQQTRTSAKAATLDQLG